MSREDQKCYYPSGDEASSNRYSVCDSDETSFKTCCPAPWTCLKNGLCESLTGKARPIASIARGACTDQNWSGCPSICPLEQMAAIAGGTVGSVVGVAILVGLGWWFWKKRSTRDQAGNGAVDENSSKGSQVAHPSVVEVDAGPDSVLVESDARTTQPNRIHELAA
ncbi:hypothetical protein NXS19_004588 [Fusarium pseudograminearum]|nr:hypothetical protein NXS19_004588 [Fusarium pseudograminearum]